MRNKLGQFAKGFHSAPETEFKKGGHWRSKQPYWDRDWLYKEYVTNVRSAKDIADQFEVTENAILHWLRKHKIKRRSMKEIRSLKHWGLSGETNGMYGRVGANNPRWLGGVTPERQALYASQEWADISGEVWKRDRKCCNCNRRKKKSEMHIHHIISFAVKELRTDIENLILLCDDCHRWVHSKRNINKKFLGEEVAG